MQPNLFVLAFTTISLSTSTYSYAQPLPVESPKTQVVTAQEDVATDTKTPRMLLSEIEQAELALYELFNGLNSSDEYDIVCRSESVEASEIASQFCEPVFLEKIRQQVDEELTQDSSARAGFFDRIRDAFTSTEARTEKLVRDRAAESIRLMQQEMEALATANPQLAAKIQTVGQLQLAYLETVRDDKTDSAYLMRQNDPTYGQSSQGNGRTAAPRPWLSAPQPGYTQPTIHFPVDAYPNGR